MENNIESIYQLYVEPWTDSPIYIGRTSQTLKVRLSGHLSESKKGSSLKCRTIRQLISEGFEIGISLLEECEAGNMLDMEDLYITNAKGRGCKLLNSKAGDTDRYDPVVSDAPVLPWSVSDFENVKWSKEYIGCLSGEQGVCVRGISFYRRGWSALRMLHPTDGKRTCHGFVWDTKLELVVDYMNQLHKLNQ